MNWIIGDLHGKARALQGLIKKVLKKDTEVSWHFVGDFVDRGENSKDVVETVINLPNATYVRGNHDEVFDLIINGSSPYSERKEHEDLNQFSWFCNFGMIDTFMSYGVSVVDVMILTDLASNLYDENIDKAYNLLNQFRSKVPQTHKDFFKNLPLVNEQKDFFVIHAFFSSEGTKAATNHEGEPFTIAEWLARNPQECQDALWGRFDNNRLEEERKWSKIGYFGHTPTKKYTDKDYIPVKGNKVVLVDTGSFIYPDGRITAFCHETGEYIQVDETGALV